MQARHFISLIGLTATSFALCACAPPLDATKPLPPPGTVLMERSKNLGFGFKEVARSQVNQPGSFEGVGHFVFVYFRDEKICQCGQNEVSIAPDGSRVLYTDVTTGKLMLFNASLLKRVELTQEFVGYPAGTAWDLKTGKAIVNLTNGNRTSIEVSL